MTVEDLKRYGLEAMREEEIDAFLNSQSIGVLGLSGTEYPYLVPLSYAHDDGTLYFTYLLGSDSRKEELTKRAGRGRFLVYTANSMFQWQSVLLDGELRSIPPSEWSELTDVLAGVWRPKLFETATPSRNVSIYAFDIVEASGIKQTGLPPGMEQ